MTTSDYRLIYMTIIALIMLWYGLFAPSPNPQQQPSVSYKNETTDNFAAFGVVYYAGGPEDYKEETIRKIVAKDYPGYDIVECKFYPNEKKWIVNIKRKTK